jgi:GNAT superfamily N-acetyltransferase
MKLDSMIRAKLATTADADLVSQMVALAYEDCQDKFKPDPEKIPAWIDWWYNLSKPQLIAHQRFIENNLTYLILLNDTVIGTFRLEQHDNKSELDDFCILPQYQNRGYGMSTLRVIKSICNTSCIEFSTPYFCTANRHLYTKAGYKEIGTRSDDTVICYSKECNTD